MDRKEKVCHPWHEMKSVCACIAFIVARTLMTIIVMTEHLLRLITQFFYNIITCALQTISILPLCLAFLITSGIRCAVCSNTACMTQYATCFVSFFTIGFLYFVYEVYVAPELVEEEIIVATTTDDYQTTLMGGRGQGGRGQGGPMNRRRWWRPGFFT
ncbi:hypothetical protein JYU34_016961 [Plutella xylostella]|uniref:Transmembrane protein n=1 Tax=Plutella xylostella TaxID=51655 RepID=A0ABQ7Q476_PLUXY|nr:hypothetical protein JYU34_016961 [Plutella xylostella]